MSSQGRRHNKLYLVLVHVIILFLSSSPVHGSYPFSNRYISNYGDYWDQNRVQTGGYYSYFPVHDPNIPSLRYPPRDYEYPGLIRRSSGHQRGRGGGGGGGSRSSTDRPQSAPTSLAPVTVNVDDFIKNGVDDTKAFMAAWDAACSTKQDVNFIVPNNKVYRLKPATFDGPCRAQVTIQILGTIEASNDMSDFENSRMFWLQFRNIDDMVVEGGGVINGNGEIWWENSCKIDKSKPCKHAPTAVTFDGCKNLMVNNVMIRDAQQMHVIFQNCINVQTTNLMISAPGNSPNTDGIHISGSQNVRIRNSVIRTGDDCVSIVSGSRNIVANDVVCGPGHGISIGSLGEGGSNDQVSNVKVDRATFYGSTNGVRIKTWQGGSGYARNLIFQNIVMHNVSNPILIDQYYCDQDEPCGEQKSAVQVSNVMYRNIRGTSGTEVAITFNCSRTYPCRAIHLQDVNLVPQGRGGGEAKSSCQNIAGLADKGMVSPTCASS